MGADDWVVIAAGLGAIAWVNWYFFLAERGSRPDRGGERPGDSAPSDSAGRRQPPTG